MNFTFTEKTRVKLCALNPRAETHGTDKVPAIDMRVEWETTQAELLRFSPWMLHAFYTREGPGPAQGALEITDESDVIPNLRFPLLAMPLRWDIECVGYTVTVDYGLGGRSNLVLADCRINNFTTDLKEGGSVVVGFRIQRQHATEKEVGKLAMRVQQYIDIFVEPPAEPESLPGMQPDQPNATDAFLAANT